MDDVHTERKKHRERRAGVKAEKKKAKNKVDQSLTPLQRNPKAFSIQHATKTSRIVQRSQELKSKKHHIPLVDRTPLDPPPVIIGVVGPPKVGKTTLLQGIVKNYAKQKLSHAQGPVTIVSGKKRRLTLMECNNDINSMIDIAKVADLVLLLVDASFGFEMETFEFLNVCQVHGFPKIMGVLTHLDRFKDNKKMQKMKKRFKHRFWTEVYSGAKLFYLSGMVYGEYPKQQVFNLCRFISVMKFRPLTWRTTHPYILADRMEDITEPEKVRRNEKTNRNISVYGYVHGTLMKNNINVHIPGCGDFSIKEMQFISDPCPTPDKEKKVRSLSQKDRIIYAPMSGVGGIVYDKDAVYIDVAENQAQAEELEQAKPSNELVTSLMGVSNTLDEKISTTDVAMFSESTEELQKSQAVQRVICKSPSSTLVQTADGRFRRLAVFEDEKPGDDDEEDDDDSDDDGDDGHDEDDEGMDSDEGIQKDLQEPPKKKMKVQKDKVEDEDIAFEDTDDEMEDVSIFSKSVSTPSRRNESNILTPGQKIKSDDSDSDGSIDYDDDSSDDNDDDDKESGDDDDDDDDDVVVGDRNHDQSDRKKPKTGKGAAKEIVKAEKRDKDESSENDSDTSDSDDEMSSTAKHMSQAQTKQSKTCSVSRTDSKSKVLAQNVKVKEETRTSKNSVTPVKTTRLKEEDSESDSSESSETDSSDEETVKSSNIPENKIKSISEGKQMNKINVVTDKKPVKGVSSKSSGFAKMDSEKPKAENESESGDSENSDSDDEEDEEDNVKEHDEEDVMESGAIRWKSNLAEEAAAAFRARQAQRVNYRKLIYGEEAVEEEKEEDAEDEIGGLFRIIKEKSEKSKQDRASLNKTDCSKCVHSTVKDMSVEELKDLIADCFVTGKWDQSDDAEARLNMDDELYGDFEDLETGEKHTAKNDDDDDDDNDDEEEESKDNIAETSEQVPVKTKAEMTADERRAEKKRKLKEMFNAQYDNKDSSDFYDNWKAQTEQQAKMNRSEFEEMEDELRVQYEGFRPGMYIRVEINDVPCELVTNFDPTCPLILGGLLSGESNIGYVQTRFKKHRWHKRILKTKNPLIFSMGWRRFQSIPIYSIQDHNMRNRLLKYTPEHLHCHASLWGPITPQGTGLLAVESVSGSQPGFRIAGTGVVLELDKSMQIVKKLKLTGAPNKIYKKTAFIEGMFNSSLEVSKFEGASIRTVSGIRGQIKKAMSQPEGCYRATFEDQIVMSDIIFLRSWFPVEVPQFYNPVTSLLLPKGEKQSWSGMKTIGQLRYERNLKPANQEDSSYKEIVRPKKTYTQLVIPKTLKKNLPFKNSKKQLEAKDPIERIAVVREPHEKKIAKVLKMMKALHAHKECLQRQSMVERVKRHQKLAKKIWDSKDKKRKERRKDFFRKSGQKDKKNDHFIKD